MAEGGVPTSQESVTLPLSQETCRLLFQQLIEDSFTTDMRENQNENIPFPDEFLNVPFEDVTNQPIRPPSSLPASENWPGDFDFRISFRNPENIKGANWIFAKDQNKLFVGRDVSCPVQFSTSMWMPNDVIIRAMALFSTSEHSSEVVTRCVNHSMNDIKQGFVEAEHLIRCEAPSSYYDKDRITNRHSVVIPYENPAGEQFSSYLFKFMCFGSCSGGPNRRPLMLVFTLERGGHVIGRQKVDLKICACPVRDYRSEEKMLKTAPTKNEGNPVHKPSKRQIQDIFGSTTFSCLSNPKFSYFQDSTPEAFLNSKKLKTEEEKRDRGEPYVIKVWNKRCYDFLNGMKRLYRAYALVTRRYPNAEDLVHVFSSMSSSCSDS